MFEIFLCLAVLSGITPLALAVSPTLGLAILAAAGMGISQGGFMTISSAMIQTIAPDGIRGRLMGVYNWHILGFMAGFNLVNGTLADITALTAPVILGGGGLAFVLVIVSSLGRMPLRRLYAQGVAAT